jgi:hypothetical protein
MKKLIAFLVVFALLAGSVFAVDLGGMVFGSVTLLGGSSVKVPNVNDPTEEASDVNASGAMGPIRIQGAGEAGDNFGGWLRADAGKGHDEQFLTKWFGIAWWKPIEQLKVSIGGNPDSHWGKDGVAAWMFYQMGSDAGVVTEPWAFGDSFYGGFFDRAALMLEITPMDMLAFNIGIPFSKGMSFDLDKAKKGEDQGIYGAGEVFFHSHAQLALNLNFGTIALTYVGGTNNKSRVDYNEAASDNSKIYAYFGLTMIDNLGIDVGIGFPFPNKDDDKNTVQKPIAAGLGVKFATDVFGVKFRAQGTFAGGVTPDGGDRIKDPFVLDLDVLPYYVMNENMSIFLSAGLKMTVPDEGDSVVGFHINPYIQVGPEWGPSFWAGFRLWTDGDKDPDDKTIMNWAIPIGLTVSF